MSAIKSSSAAAPTTGGRSTFVTITRQGGVVTAQPSGPAVAEREAGIIDPEIAAAMTNAGTALKAVVLDMSRVTFMSSMGLSMCINTSNRARAVKARTIIFGLNPELLGLLKMVKLDKLFTLATTPEELSRTLAH